MFDFFITSHLIFINQSSGLNIETLASINSYQLSMEYERRLTRKYKVQGVFLDMSRGHLKVGKWNIWHIFTSHKDFLGDRKQRVVLNE